MSTRPPTSTPQPKTVVELEDGSLGGRFLGLFYTQECVGGTWQATVLLEAPTGHGGTIKQAFTPAEGPTEEDAIRQIKERWPEAQHVSKKEFDTKLYEGLKSLMGGTGKRVVGSLLDDKQRGNFYKEPSSRKTYTPTTPARPRIGKVPVPGDLSDDSLVAPVQASKYLGVPPQYVYNRIYHGKLKSFGEKPKKVRWGDVRRQFGG